jgi:hypothetical protein
MSKAANRPAPASTPAVRDEAFWADVRAAHDAGLSPADTARRFGMSIAAIRREARRGGWWRPESGARPPAEPAPEDAEISKEATRAAPVAGDAPPHAAGLRASTPSSAALMDRLHAAIDVALGRTSDAVAHTDAAGAEVAAKALERLSRSAGALKRLHDSAAEEADEEEADDGGALLARIARVLDGANAARRSEVATLQERGVDPREAWTWDADAGEWIWDPGAALAKAAATPRTTDEGEAAPEPAAEPLDPMPESHARD